MNRSLIIAPRSLPASSRQSARHGVCDEKRPHPHSEDAMQVRQRIMKVARRLGLVFGVRSRSTAEESLVMRSSMRKPPSAGTRSPNKTKKTVRFEDTATQHNCNTLALWRCVSKTLLHPHQIQNVALVKAWFAKRAYW
ncbi:uncharacterized protein LOC119164481 isoform X2 [Rhipicephalus microplus]|uniref:uncharacterized protein LOC119164481 isoform X2 n=1 Tax=Rhipicephalus microplus TaxID=6941 RepID=UPI003F6C202C